MTKLSVNVNKIAVLRNSRGGQMPSVLEFSRSVLDAGAHGITVHPRPDQRHIKSDDVLHVSAALRYWNANETKLAEYNIEGNISAAARGSYPGLLSLLEQARPNQCTLVPDSDAQLTSDHGFDLSKDRQWLASKIIEIKSLGCRVSLFMDAGSTEIPMAAEIGADRIEIYTGPFAEQFARGDFQQALDACAQTAELAKSSGLEVNAGHDLSQQNLSTFLSHVPNVLEVSIGHALISESLYQGLSNTITNYLSIIANAKT